MKWVVFFVVLGCIFGTMSASKNSREGCSKLLVDATCYDKYYVSDLLDSIVDHRNIIIDLQDQEVIKNDQLADYSNKLNGQETQIQNLMSEKKYLESYKQNLLSNLGTKTKENEELQEQLSGFEESIKPDQVQKNNDQLACSKKLNALETQIQNLMSEKISLESEKQNLLSNLGTKTKENKELQLKLSGFEEVIVEYRREKNLENNFTVIMQSACENNKTLVVSSLLDHGMDVDAFFDSDDRRIFFHFYDSKTCLHIAAEKNYVQLIRLLIERGANIILGTKRYSRTPLIIATRRGRLEIIKILLEKGAEDDILDSNGWTPLIEACNSGYLEIAKFLLQQGANVNHKSKIGKTPIMYAAENARLDIVQLLLENGGDVKGKDNIGKSVLMYAAGNSNLEIAKILIEGGAQINDKENDGWTPLMHAAYYGQLECVKLLIETGAEINVKANDGKTALILAAIKGYLDRVKYLVEKGADINSRDNDNKTALKNARDRNKLEVVNFLKSINASE